MRRVFGWDLPPGVTDRMIDEAAGGFDEPREEDIDVAGTIRNRTWITRKGETRTAWLADYFDENRRRHTKQFPTRREADAWLLSVRGIDMADETDRMIAQMINLRRDLAVMQETLGSILVVMRAQAEHLVGIAIQLRRLEERADEAADRAAPH